MTGKKAGDFGGEVPFFKHRCLYKSIPRLHGEILWHPAAKRRKAGVHRDRRERRQSRRYDLRNDWEW